MMQVSVTVAIKVQAIIGGSSVIVVANIDVEVGLMQVALLLHQLHVLFTRTALCCPDTLLFVIVLTITLLNCIVLLIKDRIFTIDRNLGPDFHCMP